VAGNPDLSYIITDEQVEAGRLAQTPESRQKTQRTEKRAVED
jgi:hypothetical protein